MGWPPPCDGRLPGIPMGLTIAMTGKGGVGKTTLSALTVARLCHGETPVLAVDADSNANLHEALGATFIDHSGRCTRNARKKPSLLPVSRNRSFWTCASSKPWWSGKDSI